MRATLLCLLLTLGALPATAQTVNQTVNQTVDHSAHAGKAVPADASPSTQAFVAANDAMHRDMAIEFTGKTDMDFVRGMIPHHQGAVDMARIMLEFGTDPELRAFAEGIIAAQEAEIAFMNAWLAKNGI